MKKLVLILTVCALFGLKGYSQFAFGVSPGLSTNAAYFGLKINKVVPYIGFQLAHIGITTEYYETEFDGTDWYTYDDEYKLNGNLYLPEIGVKFFAIDKNKLKGYFNLNISKPLIRGSYEVDGNKIDAVADELKEIKLWAGELGFGAEYFFDDNFSVGGEFGLRYMRGKYERQETDISYGQTEVQESTYKLNISPTYSKISLNFYFGGGKAE